MDKKSEIIMDKLPKHLAIIMDGNGRWAKLHGNKRIFGHQNGVNAVKDVVEGAAELGISYLTLYAFSTENWNRPKDEVDALMSLLLTTINNEIETLQKNNIGLMAIGDIASLPGDVRENLNSAIEKTSGNTGTKLVLALSYSGRWEISEAVKGIVNDVLNKKIDPSDIDQCLVEQYLNTTKIPDPELLIRTSGENRISNFLLWQLAYCEFYFTPTLWPDFRKEHLYEAIINFQNRERRFGKTSEQICKEDEQTV